MALMIGGFVDVQEIPGDDIGFTPYTADDVGMLQCFTARRPQFTAGESVQLPQQGKKTTTIPRSIKKYMRYLRLFGHSQALRNVFVDGNSQKRAMNSLTKIVYWTTRKKYEKQQKMIVESAQTENDEHVRIARAGKYIYSHIYRHPSHL